MRATVRRRCRCAAFSARPARGRIRTSTPPTPTSAQSSSKTPDGRSRRSRFTSRFRRPEPARPARRRFIAASIREPTSRSRTTVFFRTSRCQSTWQARPFSKAWSCALRCHRRKCRPMQFAFWSNRRSGPTTRCWHTCRVSARKPSSMNNLPRWRASIRPSSLFPRASRQRSAPPTLTRSADAIITRCSCCRRVSFRTRSPQMTSCGSASHSRYRRSW